MKPANTHTRIVTVALFAVLACLLWVGKASATEALSRDQAYSNPLIPSLDAVAVEYWAARGYTLPPLEVFVLAPGASEYRDAAMAATPGGPGLWVSPWADREFLRPGEEPYVAALGCVMWLHERGHNAGLTHAAGFSVMHDSYTGIPPRCRRWSETAYEATSR